MSRPSVTREPQLADHWSRRDGWELGSRYYTWHLVWRDGGALAEQASRYAVALAEVAALDIVPAAALHLTLQGVDHAQNVSEAELRSLVGTTGDVLAGWEPFRVTFAEPEALGDAVGWVGHPRRSLTVLRDELRAVVAETLGETRMPPQPRTPAPPHVSLAYATRNTPARAVAAAIGHLRSRPIEVLAEGVRLVELPADRHSYRWTPVTSVAFGRTARP